MQKIAFILLFVFVNFLVSPSLIKIYDKGSVCVVSFENTEEENTSAETKEKVLILKSSLVFDFSLKENQNENSLCLKEKKYTQPYLFLNFPPPELISISYLI